MSKDLITLVISVLLIFLEVYVFFWDYSIVILDYFGLDS